MHAKDAIAYMASQFVGASLGCALLSIVWGNHARQVQFGLTEPGASWGPGLAFLAEFLMTFGYLTLIFYFVSHQNLLRKTPLMNWLVVGLLVWVEAPISGTSLNAARSFGPALVDFHWTYYWIYLVAPSLGGAVAAGLYSELRQGKILTGKLFHSASYPSVFKNVPHPSLLGKAQSQDL